MVQTLCKTTFWPISTSGPSVCRGGIGRGLYALARQIKEILIETLRMANFCIYDRLL